MDIVNKFKWNAWNDLGNMSQEEAKKEYIAYAKLLIDDIGLEKQ